ncbi:ABC transporter ATP-binding protein [Dactylosporangium sp. NPDC006015]|uniref:ABC transporter ATP-binding protein n=1 Tax=Dactylosporangium sp. NPDC006015 TaxID=3154576 RepID=UPI0033AC55E1
MQAPDLLHRNPGTVQAGVRVSGLHMVFRDAKHAEVTALQEVDLEVPAGQFCVLLGPSGCGKTTLLRCIAGLESPTAGTILVDGQTAVLDGRVVLETQNRPVGMVFQSYALWPHMNVAQNVAYPLTTGPRGARPAKAEVQRRVAEVLEKTRIAHLAERRIGQLSGGQQQRVALARALVAGNSVVLFDEPLSNIDAKIRENLRAELKAMQEEWGFTAIYVTHDQVEALDLADQIVVLDHGRIVQTGTPQDIYFRPMSRHVADFVGTSNLIAGTVLSQAADRVGLQTALGRVDVPGPPGIGPTALLMTRANDWWLQPQETSARDGWKGVVKARHLLGAYTEYLVEVGELTVRIWDRYHEWGGPGAGVVTGFDADAAWVVPDGG